MKVLLDHCVPRPFARLLPGHEVTHTSALGWGALKNGALLDSAQSAGFEAFVTVDRGIKFQQNIAGRRLAVIVISARSNDIRSLEPMAGFVMVALLNLSPGAVLSVNEPSGH